VHNIFGHPHPSVLEALRVHGIHTWRTDRNGTIDVDFLPAHIFVQQQFDTPR
jgi:beta-lactamase superfamily II metal-dependent hydrolase